MIKNNVVQQFDMVIDWNRDITFYYLPAGSFLPKLPRNGIFFINSDKVTELHLIENNKSSLCKSSQVMQEIK